MADNDNKIIKHTKDFIRKMVFETTYLGKKVYSGFEGNDYIFNKLCEKEPFCVVRYGAVEARCASRWISRQKYSDKNRESIKNAAGFFPNTDDNINKFCDLYLNESSYADALAVWGVENERKFVDTFCKNAKLLDIYSLEPYFFNAPWTAGLRNKKILIIHPFVDTIKSQLSNKDVLFKNSEILENFTHVTFIKAVQSNAGEITDFSTWFEALQYMKDQIDQKDFDVAIIGAGAYGLPLATYCKKIGKQAIQMAGATQILFGIKGKRWDARKEYNNLYNQFWVYPSSVDTPQNNSIVEGGCYWK